MIQSERKQGRDMAAAALELLRKQGLSASEGQEALRAAANPLLSRAGDWRSWPGELVRAAAAKPRPEYVPLVVELFPRYDDRAKAEALCLLAKLPDREAALVYIDIVRTYARTGSIPQLVTQQLERAPRHPEVFFPELLEYADDPKLAHSIYRLCLCYCQAGLLTRDMLAGASKRILDTYTALQEKLAPAQQPSGIAWMWDEEYAEPRMFAALLLDLLGHIPGHEVDAALRRALAFGDPRLRCFAVISLLRRGHAVTPNHLISVAASPETRIWLYQLLRSLDKGELFPAEYYTQAAFAESDMVNWLTFPTELGRVPDQIELMKVVSADAGPPHGCLDWYLFRFRTDDPDTRPDGAWLAGVSGPFLRKDAPTIAGRGDTFSSFQPWDAMTPDEHVGDVRQVIERWRKAHAEGKMG